MNKHTPGPWATSGVRIHIGAEKYLHVDGPKGIVALIPYTDRTVQDHIEAHADQALIAAAPQMLAALENIRASHQTGHNEDEAWRWVDDIINKAKGVK